MTTSVAPSGGESDDHDAAKALFQQGRVAAEMGQFEYSIEMFMQGLALDSDNIVAHQQLREVSLRRTAEGGRPLGMLETFKLKKGDARQNMLNAEKRLAYAPGSTDYMYNVLKHANLAGFERTSRWIGRILEMALNDSGGMSPPER